MKKVLFTTPLLEYPPAGGPFLRIATSIKALAKVSELHLVSRAIDNGQTNTYFTSLAAFFSVAPSVRNHLTNSQTTQDALPLLLKIYKHLSQTLLYQVIRELTSAVDETIKARNDAHYLVQYIKTHHIKVIWFGYASISFQLIKHVRLLLDQEKLPVKIVCDTDSVWSQFVLRKLPLVNSSWEKMFINYLGKKSQTQERHFIDWSDITTAVSEIDQKIYQTMTTSPQKIRVFPNVIDLENYQHKPSLPKNIPAQYIFLAGYFGPGSPTDLAARWFISTVLPTILKTQPHIHLVIAGKGSDYTLSDITHPNITIIGQVSSMLPFLYHAQVSIVPLQYESGTRFKILEAGACKIPVVSTTLGAEGLSLASGQELLIADTAPKFAQAVTHLLTNKKLARQLGENLYAAVKKNYALDTLQHEAAAILADV